LTKNPFCFIKNFALDSNFKKGMMKVINEKLKKKQEIIIKIIFK